MPAIAVPRATYTGWNPRAPGYGAGALYPLQGAVVPFAPTEAARKDAHDPRRSPKPCSQPHHLAVEPGKAVMAARLARIALLRAARQPAHARAAGGPFDEGLDTRGQRRPAGIGLVMNDQRARQRRGRAQDRHHVR
jgi:hypothetical protein